MDANTCVEDYEDITYLLGSAFSEDPVWWMQHVFNFTIGAFIFAIV